MATKRERAMFAFADELERSIDKFSLEWDIKCAEAVGVLELIKYRIMRGMFETVEDKDEEGEEVEDDE